MLKLLIHQETQEILGVHAIGTGATELIHIGQAVMAYKNRHDRHSAGARLGCALRLQLQLSGGAVRY